MGRLFNSTSSCQNHSAEIKKKSKCNSCVCELLNELANSSPVSMCRLLHQQLVQLVLKGESEPFMGGAVFKLLRFDPETCCAVFKYQANDLWPVPANLQVNGTSQTLALDCRCICGIICVPPPTYLYN